MLGGGFRDWVSCICAVGGGGGGGVRGMVLVKMVGLW